MSGPAPTPANRELVEALATSPLFTGMTPATIELFAGLGEEQRIERGTVLFAEATAATHLYVVLEGNVRLTRGAASLEEELLAVLGPGEVLGELAFLDGEPRSATARATDTTRVLAVPAASLEELLLLRQDLAVEILWNLVRMMSRRLRKTNERLALLARSMKV